MSRSVGFDLGRLLKDNPYFYRILELCVANMGYLRLALQARVRSSAQDHFYPYIAIDCVKAVDYSIRPANPALIEGGPFIEYHENHELLQDVSQTVPNTDGLETFDPPVKFTVLVIDQSYIIAERFEMSILGDGVTATAGWTTETKRRMEALKRALDSIDKYRLVPSRKE